MMKASRLKKVLGVTVSELLLSGSCVALCSVNSMLGVGGDLVVRKAGQDFKSRPGLVNNSENYHNLFPINLHL